MLNVHTTFYEHFFVLVLDIRTAGETLQLQGLNQQLLKLTCSQKGFAFSQATLLSAVSEACVKHGAFHVPRMRCGELPIFEIDFISSKSLHTFLSALGNGQFEGLLSLLLTKQINGMTTNSSASMENVTKFSITSDLFLLLCNSRGGGSGMREPELLHVTLANCQHCLNIVEEGQLFNYGALFRSSALRAGREENTEGGRFNNIRLLSSCQTCMGCYDLDVAVSGRMITSLHYIYSYPPTFVPVLVSTISGMATE